MRRLKHFCVQVICSTARTLNNKPTTGRRQMSQNLTKAIKQNEGQIVKEKEQFCFKIRNACASDIPPIMEIRRNMGVHEVASDLRTYIKLYPQGIRIAEAEGKIIGTASVVYNGDDENGIYFGGFFAVVPEYQATGVGQNIYNTFNERLESSNCGGNAVPSILKFYQSKGFPVLEDEWTCIRNQTSSPVFPEALSNVLPPRVNIRSFEDSLLELMFAYDYDLAGFKRSIALEMNCKEKDCKTFVAFKDGVCVGFGSIKKSCLGAGRVGPLYADDPAVAEVLLRKLLDAFPERNGFAMMTISTNVHANNFLKKLSCPVKEICYRVYTKKRMIVDTNRIFALSDMNFSPF